MQLITNTSTVLNHLSFSEQCAVKNLASALEGNKSKTMVSGDLRNVDTARSTVVSALSKLEIAGVIRSKSLGVKGTHIEVLNQEALSEIAGV